MKEKIIKKLEVLKTKKDEYVSQVVALNGAIQALEELKKEIEEEKTNGTRPVTS